MASVPPLSGAPAAAAPDEPSVAPSAAPAAAPHARQDRPRTVDELTRRNVDTIARIEAAAKVQSTGQKVATQVVAFCGSATFIWLHLLWFALWMLLNSGPWLVHPPDPYPFTFLTLVVSLEAILLSAFILSSQNQEARLSDRLNHLDLQINLLSEQENTKMLQVLEGIARHLGVKDLDTDPSAQVLEEATRPEHLVAQIERAARRRR